jgi:hypothetical protein
VTSQSTLAITWQKPDLDEELWEFSNHPAKQEWYRCHEVTWEQIVSCFEGGTLVSYPRSGTIGEYPVALSYHSYEDYKTYLAKSKRGYRKNYSKMEDMLQAGGGLTLPAPIILLHEAEALLFSGYRRLCLAWNYGMAPYVWLVKL